MNTADTDSVSNKIRSAQPQDAVLIVGFLHQLVDELGSDEDAELVKMRLVGDTALALQNKDISFFIAIQKGEPVGMARADILRSDPLFRIRTTHFCGYVDQIFVETHARKQGIGAALLRRCEAWFREKECTHTLLHAAPKALPFYNRVGYHMNRQMVKAL